MMEHIATAANVVLGLTVSSFTPELRLDGIDFSSGGRCPTVHLAKALGVDDVT